MANKMATMRGCCDCGSILPPCYVCPCLNDASPPFIMVVPTEHLELLNATDEQKAFYGNAGLMTGVFNGWTGSMTSLCQGCFAEACNGSFSRPHMTTLANAAFCFLESYGYWFVHIDTVANTVDVFLALYGQSYDPDCYNVEAPLVMNAYIRWHYTLADNTCSALQSPTHVSTHLLAFTGSILGRSATECGVSSEEEAASVGDVFAVGAGFSDPDTDLHWAIADLTPPELIFNLDNCLEPDCCAEEGGPPTSAFSVRLVGEGQCSLVITDESTPGTCGEIVRWVYEIEYFPIDDEDRLCGLFKRTIEGVSAGEEFYVPGAPGCAGQLNIVVTQTVWDEAGCRDSSEQGPIPCCDCLGNDGEMCGELSGSLTVTLIDAETCTYLLEATAGGEGICGGTTVIEILFSNADCDPPDPPCSCEEIAAGNCGGVGCSAFLGDGDSMEITISEPTTILWRPVEGDCGCHGEWTEEALPCAPCECCDGKFSGATLTVSVSAPNDCPDRAEFVSCDCAAVNGDYDCPATASCAGEHTKVDHQPCITDNGVDPPSTTYNSSTASWSIYCDEDGYWLTLGFSTGTANNVGSAFDDVFLGEEKPVCKNISATATITQASYGSGCYCNWGNTTTILADFYA